MKTQGVGAVSGIAAQENGKRKTENGTPDKRATGKAWGKTERCAAPTKALKDRKGRKARLDKERMNARTARVFSPQGTQGATKGTRSVRG